MLYQILAKIHHIRTRLMSCAKSERRGQKLVTCDLTKEEKCEQDVFFSNSKQARLTYVMGILFTDTGLLFREGRKKGAT